MGMPSSFPRVRLGDGDLGPDATVDRNVLVEMRDGVRIACDVYRPAAPGRYPVLYGVSPYLKDSVYLPTMSVYRYRETGDIAGWVAKGYVYVHADVRGTGQSEGSYVMFSAEEARDLYDMIEWCAAQNPPHLTCVARPPRGPVQHPGAGVLHRELGRDRLPPARQHPGLHAGPGPKEAADQRRRPAADLPAARYRGTAHPVV
jgi:hypothetical protein